MPVASDRFSFLNRLHAITKVLLALAAGLAGYLLIPMPGADRLTRFMTGWDIFSFVLLSMYWWVFYTTPPIHIRRQATRQDTSRVVIFVMILISTTASMLAVVLLLTARHETAAQKTLHLAMAIIGMTFSWSLVHTVFSVRYAHMYYADHRTHPDTHAGGLDFPDEDKPDFVDFAYFSFVLGMTFQVSDVSISSRRIRRMVLWHSLISFGYNAVIIALTINVVAGFGG
ncbi:MAG TPA: DUF1345 domain-containing protein [Chitinophagaceae bacterium]|nr:DUF1345 domain-containing protein [Chitinophagaceae bacterium]